MFESFMTERRPLVRHPRHRALVSGGARARPPGAAPLRSPWAPRVCGDDALELPRLARRHVRVGCGARTARPLGAAHGARPRSGDLGLHDAGDRLRAPTRRDARPEGRRCRCSSTVSPGSCATPVASSAREPRSSAFSSRAARPTAVRLAGGETIRARAGRRRERHADAALRRAARRGRGAGRASSTRLDAIATDAARCRSTSRCPSRPTGTATTASRERRSCT